MNTAERKQVYFNKPQRLLKTDSTENPPRHMRL